MIRILSAYAAEALGLTIGIAGGASVYWLGELLWALGSGAVIDVTEPVAGFYRLRLHSRAVRGVVCLWFGPPHDPVTGEEMDRSHRWQAEMNGEPIEFDRVWPACAGEPLTEQDYRRAIARQEWAQDHAPDSAYADPRARHDLLRAPLPF